jgi:GT2 family glycosyltransferase
MNLHRYLLNPLRIGKKLERLTRQRRRRQRYRKAQRQIPLLYAQFDTSAVLQACPSQPRYSLIVPVYRTDPQWLTRCIDSVRSQLYPNWELILVDDASRQERVTKILLTAASSDDRIRAFELDKNQGISGATNFGLQKASGKFVGFLDHDDELTPDALLWMVAAHNHAPHARWFYSDEAVMELDGNYVERFHYKPAYSAEYLLSVMYTCHFSVYERELIERAGGLRPEFDGAQDHDLALRIADLVSPDQVKHIPHVLYFWRAVPESTASTIQAKPGAASAGHRAVCEAVERRNLPAMVFADQDQPTLFHLRLENRATPKVAVVIPTRNRCDLMTRCISTLRGATRYPNYEIAVIDNQSDEPELERYLTHLNSTALARTFRYDKPFNHSDMHNVVIPQLDVDLVVLANNDVYNFSPGWLEQLVATLELDESIAGAGGLLTFPDGSIQHAGVVIGVAGLAGNAMYGVPKGHLGYLGRDRSLQQVAAVTGALMIVRKHAFQEVGGFDAERFPTSYNDVDLWLRLGDAGYRCLYNPEVKAVHDESRSRGVPPKELEYRRRLTDDLKRRHYVDPFWHLDVFDDPRNRIRKHSTDVWVVAKLERLRDLAAHLSHDRPSASATPTYARTRAA